MPRARNIKPGFYKNEDLAECSVWARYIFPGLWMLADREGRLEDRPKRIKGELLPFDGQDVEPLLRELMAKGFILRYRNSEGSFIQITKFKGHQSPHYSEKPSVIKPPVLREYSESSDPIKGVSQPPDSLNPESLVLTPDSKPIASPDSSGSAGANGAAYIPLAGGKQWAVPKAFLGELEAAYPRVAGLQTLLEIRAWCISNPANCKTERGVRRFINRWFEREQNKPVRTT